MRCNGEESVKLSTIYYLFSPEEIKVEGRGEKSLPKPVRLSSRRVK